MTEPVTDDDLRRILSAARIVAVLGAHDEPGRAAFYVPDYLADHGYRVLPVNPMLTGKTLFGEPVVPRLRDLSEPVDLVDVFRRGSALPLHVDDILGMNPLPRVVWFQLGISNDEVAARLRAAGIEVIQNRCTLADHSRLHLGDVERRGPST